MHVVDGIHPRQLASGMQSRGTMMPLHALRRHPVIRHCGAARKQTMISKVGDRRSAWARSRRRRVQAVDLASLGLRSHGHQRGATFRHWRTLSTEIARKSTQNLSTSLPQRARQCYRITQHRSVICTTPQAHQVQMARVLGNFHRAQSKA